MSQIANYILSSVDTTTLLNWDAETSLTDLKENVKYHVFKYTGYDRVSVDLEDNILVIQALTQLGVQTLLRYNVSNGREIYGRVRSCGFTHQNMLELGQFKTVH